MIYRNPLAPGTCAGTCVLTSDVPNADSREAELWDLRTELAAERQRRVLAEAECGLLRARLAARAVAG